MTTIDPFTSSIDSIRDWLATEQWPAGGQRTDENGIRFWKRCSPEDWSHKHPYPPTLDGAASAMPEGVRTFKSLPTRDGSPVFYDAVNSDHLIVATVPDTGDEIADRYRLAAACIIATKESA